MVLQMLSEIIYLHPHKQLSFTVIHSSCASCFLRHTMVDTLVVQRGMRCAAFLRGGKVHSELAVCHAGWEQGRRGRSEDELGGIALPELWCPLPAGRSRNGQLEGLKTVKSVTQRLPPTASRQYLLRDLFLASSRGRGSEPRASVTACPHRRISVTEVLV